MDSQTANVPVTKDDTTFAYWRAIQAIYTSYSDYMRTKMTRTSYLLKGKIFVDSIKMSGFNVHEMPIFNVHVEYPDGTKSKIYSVSLKKATPKASLLEDALRNANASSGIDGFLGGVYYTPGFSVRYMNFPSLDGSVASLEVVFKFNQIVALEQKAA